MAGHIWKHRLGRVLLVLLCMGVAAGCHRVEPQGKPAEVPEIRPGILTGYLQMHELPNSLALMAARYRLISPALST